MKCLLGIYRDYGGCITIDGEDIRFDKPKDLARKMAYIPQSHAPAFHYSVLDMTLMGTTSAMTAFANPKEREVSVAREALRQLQIGHLEQRDFMKISGGEQQLVLMCAWRRTFLKGESPKSALVVGRIQPRPRVSIVRWNLKEGGGKSLV